MIRAEVQIWDFVSFSGNITNKFGERREKRKDKGREEGERNEALLSKGSQGETLCSQRGRPAHKTSTRGRLLR